MTSFTPSKVAQLTSHEVLGSSSGQLASGVEDHFSAQAVSRLLLKKLLMMLKDLLMLLLFLNLARVKT